MIALLGRRDSPTDGVEDYCRNLSHALQKSGHELSLIRVPWAELGWIRALDWLRHNNDIQEGQWVLAQYNALAWSRHGFSLGFLAVLWILRRRQARVASFFHDVEPYGGTRLVDRIRRACQLLVTRTAYRWASRSIVAVPTQCAPCLPANPTKAALVPIGANIPSVMENGRRQPHGSKTVAVFSVTGGGTVGTEIADIAFCMTEVSRHFVRARLVVLGRDSKEAEGRLREALSGVPVQIEALGLLPPEDVSQTLRSSDALLFVRGPISTKKSTATAGIACGLPVVAYAGSQTAPPLTEAGVILAPEGNQQELAEALIRVLSDDELWQELHERNLRAQVKYFSWDAIAARLVSVLSHA